MKKRFLYFVPLLSFFAFDAYAAKTYGKIEYVYKSESKDSPASNNYDNAFFTQLYELGYMDYVYSPRLLKYNVKGGFFLSDANTNVDGDKRSGSSQKEKYDIRLDAIQGSKYPFSIYAKRYEKPMGELNIVNFYASDDTTNDYGILGSAKIGTYDLNYRASSLQNTNKSDYAISEMDRNELSLNLKNKLEAGSWGIGYNLFDDSRYVRNYASPTISSTAEEGQSLAAYLNLDLAKKTDMRLDAKYEEDERSTLGNMTKSAGRMRVNHDVSGVLTSSAEVEYKETEYEDLIITENTTQASAIWTPTKKFSTNMRATSNFIDNGGEEQGYTLMDVSSNYKITPKFSFNQNVMFFNSMGEDKTFMDKYGLGVVYSDNYERIGFRGNYNTELGYNYEEIGSIDQLTRKEGTVEYRASGSASKNIESIDTQMKLHGRFYTTQSNIADSSTTGFQVDGGLEKKITLHLTLSGDVSLHNETESESEKVDILSAKSSLSYAANVGRKGSANASLGAFYTDDHGRIITGRNGNLRFKYYILNGLTFLSNADYSRTVSRVSGNVDESKIVQGGIAYGVRKIAASIMARQENRTTGSGSDSTQTILYMKVTRRF